MTASTSEDLLQSGDVVKDRWKVVRIPGCLLHQTDAATLFFFLPNMLMPRAGTPAELVFHEHVGFSQAVIIRQ